MKKFKIRLIHNSYHDFHEELFKTLTCEAFPRKVENKLYNEVVTLLSELPYIQKVRMLYDQYPEYVTGTNKVKLTLGSHKYYLELPFKYAKDSYGVVLYKVESLEGELKEKAVALITFDINRTKFEDKCYTVLRNIDTAQRLVKLIPEAEEFIDVIHTNVLDTQEVNLDDIKFIRNCLKAGGTLECV